jgi:hypothetical protein
MRFAPDNRRDKTRCDTRSMAGRTISLVTSHALDADAMLQRSASRHGLEATVDPGIAERFHHMIGLMNDFGRIADADFPAAVAQIEAMLTKRLKVARDWQQNPEILDGEIKQPFFVIGSARAGTTFAQMMLTLDEGHRTPVYSEVQNPSPPRGLDPAFDAAARADQDGYVDYMVQKSPRMMSAHPYLDQGGNSEAEDEYVYSLDFHMVYPLQLLKVPNMPQAQPPRDPVLAMQFHKNMLRQFQWKTPTRRWVGKGVVHHYIMPAVLEVYPDAVCFWTHRSPEEYVASLLEILEIQYQPFNGGMYKVDPDAMVEQLKAGVDYILASPATSDARVHHIRFKDLIADPAAVIAPIYEARGIKFTDAYAEKIRARRADPAGRADRYGKFEYSMAKYGLTRERLRATFAEYCDRFEI